MELELRRSDGEGIRSVEVCESERANLSDEGDRSLSHRVRVPDVAPDHLAEGLLHSLRTH